MIRAYFTSSIDSFLNTNLNEILGVLTRNSDFDVNQNQSEAWIEEINILKNVLTPYEGTIYFEYSIPRMGKRIDVIVIIEAIIFVLEFKIGANSFLTSDIDQVWDYALDLKNFHETSHNRLIAPILIATNVNIENNIRDIVIHEDKTLVPIKCTKGALSECLSKILKFSDGDKILNDQWESGSYRPTPSIIEAAKALYKNHSVEEIVRKDATAKNLSETTKAISEIILQSKSKSQKAICFVTGVPGSGKTLVGLNIATKHINERNGLQSVFLSGNGPLVAVLREALVRDKVKQEKEKGKRVTKGEVLRNVKSFIQNVHHYRDLYLEDKKAPFDHVAIFDEAQRAWNLHQTVDFMNRKKGIKDFAVSEPEFLISCLDRHLDWAVIVCLVGGGQEINKGEAGISEWIDAIQRSFPKWKMYISSKLTDSEYSASKNLSDIKEYPFVVFKDELHLNVSMRSFRAEKVSLLVKQLLDLDKINAKDALKKVNEKYPMVLTRDLGKAKRWLRDHARGTERYGIVVSSQAERLKPHAIFVKAPMNPVNWFLDEKDDVRSSYYLEDVATEFHVQGLELDWACVTWDADFRYSNNGWINRTFHGNKWKSIKKSDRMSYQKNAYRVLLTRARQGIVIVVPEGNDDDPTRKKDFYDPTYKYLKEIGFDEL